jgi:hypothetical protein
VLSDADGISIHRFQSLIVNAAYGVWFIIYVLLRIHPFHHCRGTDPDLWKYCQQDPQDYIMPDVSENNLLLLSLSALTYSVFRNTSSKKQTARS